MRLACCFMAVVVLSFATSARAAESDLTLLQGTWLVEQAEEDGKPIDRLKDASLTFIADNVISLRKEGTEQKAEVNAISLDETASPRRFTVFSPRDRDQTESVAIYKLDGDTFTICLGVGPGGNKAVPTDFSSGEKKALVTLKRQTPAEPLKGDAKLLQGSWTVESAERDGKPRDELKGANFAVGGGIVVKSMKQGVVSRTVLLIFDGLEKPVETPNPVG